MSWVNEIGVGNKEIGTSTKECEDKALAEFLDNCKKNGNKIKWIPREEICNEKRLTEGGSGIIYTADWFTKYRHRLVVLKSIYPPENVIPTKSKRKPRFGSNDQEDLMGDQQLSASAEHTEISKFVSYIAENVTDKKWREVASALNENRMLTRQAQREDVELFWNDVKYEKIASKNNLLERSSYDHRPGKLNYISIDLENIGKRPPEYIVNDDTINSVVSNSNKKSQKFLLIISSFSGVRRLKQTSPHTSTNDEVEESSDPNERLEIDLENVTKQLEMIPLYEWKVGDINITQRFRQYQQKVIDKVKTLASIIILARPCPYLDFTETEWYTITQAKPFVIEQPIIPSAISTTFQEAIRKHLMDDDSYIYADSTELSRAAASTFNEFQSPREYGIQLNRAVKGTRKRPDFTCVVDKIPVLVSEFKPLGCTPLLEKKDFVKAHLRAKKSLNQQSNFKDGPGEVGLFINTGDIVRSFFMDLKYGFYCSWSFHTTKLAVDKASMPLVESTFSHFVALERRVNKLAKDFKRRKQPFTPPGQMKFMSEFPDSPQINQLLR
ncbi:2130_t:CDS:10 [Entrophospora sp. SA101]|nr:2130_t:CDS:10 [Entrophospora sp. SA101]